MSKKEEYEQRTEKLLEPMLQARNFELVDVEYIKEGQNYILRAYIDKEGGITIDDCEVVNRELSDVMDQEDFIPEAYILEVSSPGLGRQLKKERDFIRSMGEDVEIKLYHPVTLMEDGKKIQTKELLARLTGYEEGKLTLGFEAEETMTLELKEIAMIRLAIDF